MRPAWALAALLLPACAAFAPRPPAPPAPPPVPALPAPPPAPAPPPPPPVAAEPDDVRQVTELLGYYQRVAQMNADEQRREVAAAVQAHNRERSGYNRVRLAMLYALPNASIQDDTRALQLLEPLPAVVTPGPLRQFAGLLAGQVSERVKTHKRADQLKEQLEGLRAIERSMIQRDQQPPKKP
jgi:hypothetical protein